MTKFGFSTNLASLSSKPDTTLEIKMKYLCFLTEKLRLFSCVYLLLFLFAVTAFAQEQSGKSIYDQVKAFNLTGGKAEVSNLTLKRDRVEMTFTGTFYFSAPVEGKVTGAVFVGQGNFKAEVPPNKFEKDNVQRLLKADVVESDFKTAVFRFTDDTFEIIGKTKQDGAADSQTQKLALESDERIIKETGANLAARLAVSRKRRPRRNTGLRI